VHTTGPDGGFNGGIMVYSGESGLEIYGNVFDGGGEVGQFYAPAINIGENSLFAAVRNNVFTGFSDVTDTYGRALVSGSAGAGVTYADYNAWFNPLTTQTTNYSDGLVTAPGEHDVQGDPVFAGTAEIPYPISAGCIWSRTYTTAEVLAHYRQIYSPGDGSPLIGAGDPADGAGSNIGAIGLGDGDPTDQFGRVLQ